MTDNTEPTIDEMIDTAFEAGFFHRIGSHSDDVGGESDKPCHCLWKEAVKALIRTEKLVN